MRGKEHNGNGHGDAHCSTCGSCAGCGSCGCGSGHSHLVARLVIGIIIVVIAFWLGLKLGELRAEFYNSGYYGSNMPWGRMMQGSGYRSLPEQSGGYVNLPQMMQGVNGGNSGSEVTPSY